MAAVLHPGLVAPLPVALNWRHEAPFAANDTGILAGPQGAPSDSRSAPEPVVIAPFRNLSVAERADRRLVAVPPFVEGGVTCVVHYNDYRAFRSRAFR